MNRIVRKLLKERDVDMELVTECRFDGRTIEQLAEADPKVRAEKGGGFYNRQLASTIYAMSELVGHRSYVTAESARYLLEGRWTSGDEEDAD